MTSDDKCPKCGADDICLVDPSEEVWLLDPSEYSDEDAEVWLCTDCGWNEEATLEESLEEANANLEFALGRLAEGGQA